MSIRQRAAKFNVQARQAFFATAAEVFRLAKDNAPVGKWFGGTLRRSASIRELSMYMYTQAVIAFNAIHAQFVHQNYGGTTIKPSRKYLYVPLTRRGAKAGQTRDYLGVRRGKDYILTTKPVRIPPQPKAGFLARHCSAKQFWARFNRILERLK